MAQVIVTDRPVPRTPAPVVTAGVFGLAFAARLLPLLRGGGLRGYGSYDDSVYFAAAAGWVHGRWPYRDFLLVQPPGIVVALAPFAGLAPWVGDSGGLAVARLAWMLVGSLTAVGLVALLWQTSPVAAMMSGLFYAFFWPATMVERLTDLEGPQNLLLVVALLLLRPFGPSLTSRRAQRLAGLMAGMALGLAWSIKIWELAPIVVLAGWLALRPRRRELIWFGVGVVGAASAVCLPFFVAAPRQMWTMVLVDQLHRPRHPDWVKRLVYSTGTSHLLSIHRIGLGLILVLIALGLTLALAWRRSAARVVVVLYLVLLGVLLVSPPTYVHYGAFVAPPMAILVGVAIADVIGLVQRSRPVALRLTSGGIVGTGICGLLVVLAYAPATARIDAPVPTGRLPAVADATRGCISYDEPSEALSLNLVSRDLDRGCPFVVDLGGQSHWTHMHATLDGRPTRSESFVLRYLRSGSAGLLYRYPPGHRAVNIVGRWTLLARDHRLRLVRPGSEGLRS